MSVYIDQEISLSEKINMINQLAEEVKRSVFAYEQSQFSVTKMDIISQPNLLGQKLDKRRKELGISMSLLELQTGASLATLSRLFKNPEQVKFATVVNVAEALGVRLCTVE